MNLTVAKVAPSAVVLAFVGYCMWPSLAELASDPQPKPREKVPELAAALFSPAMSECPTQNPFGGSDAASLAAQAEPGKASGKGPGAAADSGKAAKADRSAGSDALTLNATCILGDQRLAVINGELYAPQQTLSTGVASYKVLSVSSHKVLLERGGKTVELTYADVAARPSSSSQASVRPKLGSAGPSTKSGGSH